MRWRTLGIGATILVALAGLAWAFRFDLIIAVARLKLPNVAANHPVRWAQGPETAPAGPRSPNIVFILADDLGYNDITLNGGGVAGGTVPTPNIDGIAKAGVTFANGYAGNATCAPSRAAIMTGRYATRFGFEFTPTGIPFARVVGSWRSPGTRHPPQFHSDRTANFPEADDQAVPTSEITIAQMLKGQGYHTVHLGKWHLGGAKGTRPEQRGFDESLGFMAGASAYLAKGDPGAEESHQSFDPIDKVLWGLRPFGVQYNGSPWFAPNEYMTDYLTDQAMAAIRANRNRPFFLYLAYNAPHTPLQATKADFDALPQIKDHRLRVYAAMIRNLDRNIGRVLAELKAQGLDDNTLVIFTSDNGGAHYIGLPEINRPYRGWKATFFEGGVHVPFMMRWPGKLPSGATYSSPVAHVDIFATAAAAAGAPVAKDRVMDGVDLATFVTGKTAGDPHKSLFWRSGGYRTLLMGGWKLQVLDGRNKVWLYNLATDPTERHELSASQPAKLAEMQAELARTNAQMKPPAWPSLLTGAIAIDHPLGVPDKADDDYIYWDN